MNFDWAPNWINRITTISMVLLVLQIFKEIYLDDGVLKCLSWIIDLLRILLALLFFKVLYLNYWYFLGFMWLLIFPKIYLYYWFSFLFGILTFERTYSGYWSARKISSFINFPWILSRKLIFQSFIWNIDLPRCLYGHLVFHLFHFIYIIKLWR